MTIPPEDELWSLLAPLVLYLGAFYVLTPGSHGRRGLDSWIGGHPIQGLAGVADMVGLLIAIAVGMLVAGAAAGPRRLARPAISGFIRRG